MCQQVDELNNNLEVAGQGWSSSNVSEFTQFVSPQCLQALGRNIATERVYHPPLTGRDSQTCSLSFV